MILSLASFNIASLLTREEGFTINGEPSFSFLRRKLGVKYNTFNEMYGENFFSSLFACLDCMSRWTSLLMVIGYVLFGDTFVWIVSPFALSTVVMLLGKFE